MLAPKSVIREDLRLVRESSDGSGCQKIPLVTMPQANWIAWTLQSIYMGYPAIFFDQADKKAGTRFLQESLEKTLSLSVKQPEWVVFLGFGLLCREAFEQLFPACLA